MPIGRSWRAAAQARIAIKPFLDHPIIERTRKCGRHVLAEQKLDAVEAIAHGAFGPPAIEHLLGELRKRGLRISFPAARLRSRAERRTRRITVGLERRDAALHHAVAPVVVKMRQQRLQAGRGRMDIAIDGGRLAGQWAQRSSRDRMV
jgi:hypothetical protein